MKNKDEFYFGMINSRTKKGVHMQSRGNETLDVDLVKVLKTQDAGYVRTVLSAEVKVSGLSPWRDRVPSAKSAD